MNRNGSRQTDQGKWFDGKPEKNRRRGVCLRQTPLRWMPSSWQNARGGMFSSMRKNAWVRVHHVPIALFYAKKVL